MKERYDHKAVEAKWSSRWEREGVHRVDLDRAVRPFYNLMMFPYPSAEGLHVGNVFAFVGSDVQGRYHAARGYDVFEPMGFDAFGMHSENFALRTGTHPWHMVPRNVERFRETQLKRIGNRFDWSHEVDTTDPGYYRWTQWLFLEMHRHGLAYRGWADLNWCPTCRTVLADEQAESGSCERCDTPVQRRAMEQWFLRISAYAQRLLDGLDRLDWSETTKTAQRRWIGRSEGVRIRFPVRGAADPLEVFTTRPDTLWGATFLAISPGCGVLDGLMDSDRRTAVERYRTSGRAGGSPRTGGDARPKSGVPTGLFAVHPGTGSPLPIWVADYVSSSYGTGAVMGVPAHDRRDLELAEALGLPVVPVVRPVEESGQSAAAHGAYEGEGVLEASGPFTGMATPEARRQISAWLAREGIGAAEVRYRLHDWCVSRQRYWGPPIPMIHCERCGIVPVPEAELPVLLPYLEGFQPDGSGLSPLARCESFAATACPRCRGAARRETDVSDNFLDSAWYFLRYPSSDFPDRPFDPERTRRWLPVARYVGGNEHAVLHLLYTRFVTMALHDMGWLAFEEPFVTFRAHGLLVKDGAKMSKSRGNVVNPDAYLERYGADVLRTYLMFAGDFQASGDFRDGNITGIERFIARVWRLAGRSVAEESAPDPDLEVRVREKVRRVTADIERLHYNTAIAACMGLLSEIHSRSVPSHRHVAVLLRLLEPFAPFVTHELWERIGGQGMLCAQPWPHAEEDARELVPCRDVSVAIQVDGKLRDTMPLRAGTPEEEAVHAALARDRVRRHVVGRRVARSVYVQDRILNIVTTSAP